MHTSIQESPGQAAGRPSTMPRLGAMLDVSAPLSDVVGQVAAMADAGMHTALVTNVTGHYDALTLLAIAGREVPDIELITGVVPVFPHHPIWLAAQALTTQAATGGRLTLGIGLSHRFVAEGVFGFPFDRPARRMREHLDVLLPLLRGEQVAHRGETLRAVTRMPIEIAAPAPPVLLAALGPRMLDLAGTRAAGTVTWMTGPTTLAQHIVPTIRAAAAGAGRPVPRTHVIMPICVSDDRSAARQEAVEAFGIYNAMPSYRAMLDREGARGPEDVALIGDEDDVTAQIAGLGAAGATEVTALVFGGPAERRRTGALVAELAAASR